MSSVFFISEILNVDENQNRLYSLLAKCLQLLLPISYFPPRVELYIFLATRKVRSLSFSAHPSPVLYRL
jgi:hypothetical protein